MSTRHPHLRIRDRKPTTTVELYCYDELGRHVGNATGTVTVIAGGRGGLEAVLGDINVPPAFVTPYGPRTPRTFALHPEGHEKHQKVPLP